MGLVSRNFLFNDKYSSSCYNWKIKDLDPERDLKICHVLVSVALQQEPTILRYKEDRFQVDGKGDRVNAALKHIQHLQLVATVANTHEHKHTAQLQIYT